MRIDRRKHIIKFFKEDLRTNFKRFIAEFIGLIMGIGATTILAFTMPNPNLLVAYIMWEVSALCLIYGGISRGSVGLTLLYVLYFIIDAIGLYKLLTIPA
jgi:hypothetical protein